MKVEDEVLIKVDPKDIINGTCVIPEGVTDIGAGAFEDLHLTSINIPNSVKTIYDCAFLRCKQLISVNIPNSVKYIGDYAFAYCKELISVNIPDGVKRIGSYTFADCYNLTRINIPNSVKYIGSYAFANCYNLTRINIPNSVTSIGKQAFEGCDNLTITIPNSTKLEGDPFHCCSCSVEREPEKHVGGSDGGRV